MIDKVYIFHGEGSQFSSAVFSNPVNTKEWIEKKKVTGMLTEMPLDKSVYDWAIEKDFFTPNKDYQKEPKFIQRFISASLEHWHFEEGVLVS